MYATRGIKPDFRVLLILDGFMMAGEMQESSKKSRCEYMDAAIYGMKC